MNHLRFIIAGGYWGRAISLSLFLSEWRRERFPDHGSRGKHVAEGGYIAI